MTVIFSVDSNCSKRDQFRWILFDREMICEIKLKIKLTPKQTLTDDDFKNNKIKKKTKILME